MKKIIWIINQYASHLTTRHEELSKSFANQGYNVVVITSSFHHGRREYIYKKEIVYRRINARVSYVYLHSAPSYKNNGGGRVLNMLDFVRLLGKNTKKIAGKFGAPCYVIASSAPPFVWEIGYRISKKYKSKYIVEFRDIWPLSLIDIQGVNPRHPFVKVLEIIEKRAYKRSDAIVSTMPKAWKHVVKVSGVSREKIHWMANGINIAMVEKDLHSDLELPDELRDYLTNHWCCVYIGSIVKSECLDYLITCFSEVNDPDIFFAVIGEGHEKENIIELSERLNLKNVKFFSSIDRHLIPKVLELSATAVAAVKELDVYKYGLSMNKLNDYLASGIPIIFACDVDNVVREAGHFSVPMGEKALFVEAIKMIHKLSCEELEALSKNARFLIRNKYDYRIIGKKYIKMMEEL